MLKVVERILLLFIKVLHFVWVDDPCFNFDSITHGENHLSAYKVCSQCSSWPCKQNNWSHLPLQCTETHHTYQLWSCEVTFCHPISNKCHITSIADVHFAVTTNPSLWRATEPYLPTCIIYQEAAVQAGCRVMDQDQDGCHSSPWYSTPRYGNHTLLVLRINIPVNALDIWRSKVLIILCTHWQSCMVSQVWHLCGQYKGQYVWLSYMYHVNNLRLYWIKIK